MKILTQTIRFTSLLILALSSTLASADRTAYPGSICQPYYGNRAADLTYTGSRIFNNSSTSISISCPLARTDVTSLYGISASIYGYRNGAHSSSIYCSVTNSSHYGTTSYFTGRSNSTSGWFNTYLRLNKSNYGGNHNVYCSLPPYSSITEISVYEF